MKIQSYGAANIKFKRDKQAFKHVGGGADLSRNPHPCDKHAKRHVGGSDFSRNTDAYHVDHKPARPRHGALSG